MITQLTGILLEAELTEAVIDVQGVGYAVSIPISTYEKLPRPGEKVTLFTFLQPREDAWTLYGFISREERSFFKLLTGISGIGPKLALNALSALSVEVLSNAIAQGDVKSLSKINGIGKRSAERMILELKDKIGTLEGEENDREFVAAVSSQAGSEAVNEAMAALAALGYSNSEIMPVLRKIPDYGTLKRDELIRKALQMFAKK